MIRTASTPLQALAIPAGVAVVLFVLAAFTGGVDAPRVDTITTSDAPSSLVHQQD